MAGPPPRRVWLKVFQNIWKSLSPGYIRASAEGGGKYMGEDYIGNKYYEKPADPGRGRNLPTRYFAAPDRASYVRENLPAEWDSWLRGRRRIVPTVEELQRNLAIAQMKKDNAMKLGYTVKDDQPPEYLMKYPVYDEYEVNPGQEEKTNKKDS